RELLPLAGLVLACALATLLNPYAIELPKVWLAVMNSPVVHQLIMEHRPLAQSLNAPTVVAFAVVYVAVLVSVPWRQLRVTWLLPLPWAYLAWTRIRHGPLFATVSILAIGEMLPYVRWSAWLSKW